MYQSLISGITSGWVHSIGAFAFFARLGLVVGEVN
jgi:hypothetical protein